jgi:hypothetical protein
MCLILAIVGVVFPSMTPRRCVYGDQGQEVAWEVGQERLAKREQGESKDHQVARPIRSGSRRVVRALSDIGEARTFRDGDL